MLNYEEYKKTFNVDISLEEFKKLKAVSISDPDIELLTVVDPKTHQTMRFVPLKAAEWFKLKNQVVCSNCRHIEGAYKYKEYRFCPYCGARIIKTEAKR